MFFSLNWKILLFCCLASTAGIVIHSQVTSSSSRNLQTSDSSSLVSQGKDNTVFKSFFQHPNINESAPAKRMPASISVKGVQKKVSSAPMPTNESLIDRGQSESTVVNSFAGSSSVAKRKAETSGVNQHSFPSVFSGPVPMAALAPQLPNPNQPNRSNTLVTTGPATISVAASSGGSGGGGSGTNILRSASISSSASGQSSSPSSSSSSTSTTITSTSPSPSGTANAPVAPLKIWAAPSSGQYSQAIKVVLTQSRYGSIYYCLSTDVCCDPAPDKNGVAYNSNSSGVTIGEDDGPYCLSFYGKDVLGNVVKGQEYYTIGDNTPNLSMSLPLSQVQTNQLALLAVQFSSSDFSKENYTFRLYNLFSDPSDANCQGIDETYSSFIYDLTGSGGPVSLQFPNIPSSPYALNLNLGQYQLHYGENYLVPMLINQYSEQTSYYGCQKYKLTLSDFEIFHPAASSSLGGAHAADEIPMEGDFSPIGGGRMPASDGEYLLNDFDNIIN